MSWSCIYLYPPLPNHHPITTIQSCLTLSLGSLFPPLEMNARKAGFFCAFISGGRREPGDRDTIIAALPLPQEPGRPSEVLLALPRLPRGSCAVHLLQSGALYLPLLLLLLLLRHATFKLNSHCTHTHTPLVRNKINDDNCNEKMRK